ncbi:MAG: Hsp20/alpha crystallin family protein [Nitrospiraceae bacterium]
MMILNESPVPFRNGSLDSQIDRVLSDAIQSVNQWSKQWNPACNVYENDEGFTVQIALPGWDAKEIDVQVEDQILCVQGGRNSDESEQRIWYERGIGTGPFSSSFRLPDYADQKNAKASHNQGLLTITFPKREEAKARHILIDG